MLDLQDYDGGPALDTVQSIQAAVGTGWLSGCTPTLVDTDAAIRIQITAGDVSVVPDPTSPPSDPTASAGQQTVDLPDGDPNNPRKDIVYVDDGGSLGYAKGTPRTPVPLDKTARDTEQPTPPDLADDPALSSQTAAAPIAEIWVPAGAAGASDMADGTIDYVRDRRLRPWAAHLKTDGDAPTAHASTHHDGGSDELDVAALAGGAGSSGQVPQTDGSAVSWTTLASGDLSDFTSAAQSAVSTYDDNVVASGSVTLSSGSATVDTGVSTSTTATFTVYLGPSTDDAELAADIVADSGSGNYVVEIQETDTSVGNPSCAYDVVRLR